jgi:hypothetical protein
MIDTEVMDTLSQSQEEVVSETNQEHPQQQAAPVEEDKREKNLKILRERSARAEKERDEAVRRLQEIESLKAQSTPQPEDDEITLGPDELAEGKHLSRVTRKIRKLEEELKSYRQQASVDTTEARLKAQYPDFDKIVTQENIELLRDAYPEIAQTIHSSSDLYSRAASAYTIIKKMGIAQDTSVFDADKIAAQKNSYKPKPTASISPQQGDTPLSKANAFANGLTPELQAQLLKEMQAARRAL